MTQPRRARPLCRFRLLALAFAVTAALGAARPTLGQSAAAPAPTPEPSPAPAAAAKPWYEEIAVNGFVSASYSYNMNRPGLGHEPVPGLRLRRQHVQGGRRRARPPEGRREARRGRLPRRRRGRRLDPARLGRGRALPRLEREGAGLRPPAGLRELDRAGRERAPARRREVRHAPRLRGHRGIRRLQRQRDALVPASGTRSPSRTPA